VIELFFAGEPLTDEVKAGICSTAARYGLKEEQLRINDYSTTENVNDIELVKGIYERMDSEIGERDAEIHRLQTELQLVKDHDIPYVQLTREIASNYPSVKEVHIARGERVMVDNTDSVARSIVVVVRTDDQFDEVAHSKLVQWLKVRLEEDDVMLFRLPAVEAGEQIEEQQ
jgi:hypothetical protein